VSIIIVGVDGSERSADALGFAATLARRARADLLLACAYPYDDAAAHMDTTRRRLLREEAQETLDRLAETVEHGVPVATRTIADRSPARALHTLAVHERASLIVLGSSHRGAVGRVFAGTTAERLLHGAPCPVAVVPHGRESGLLRAIAVGWDGSAEAAAALTAAAALARPDGAQVRVVEVLDSAWTVPPAHGTWPAPVSDPREQERRARERLEQVIAGLPERVEADPVVLAGDPVDALAAQSADADLLVLGSRGYGPHRAVLLGSVSGRVVRTAACPVIVVPRGVSAPFEDLFRRAPVVRAIPHAM
jgi:nucleotide-binding universal stress UspA family protein